MIEFLPLTLLIVTLVCCIHLAVRNMRRRQIVHKMHDARTQSMTEAFNRNPALEKRKITIATGNASERLHHLKQRKAERRRRWEESQRRVSRIGANIVD